MLKIAFDPIYEHPLPEGHRFPMLKYRLLPEQLVYEGSVKESAFFSPPPPADSIIELAHDASYIQKVNELSLSASEIRKIGFPLSAPLIQREKIIMNGTWQCTQFALEYGISMNVAGGTHHAFRDRGEGFCILNDQAVAATNLLHSNQAKRILIIDLDVHQGNGTAQIFKDDNRVFTFSIHGKNNYPAQKEISDWDIPLPDRIEDSAYLKVLDDALPKLLERAEPDFIFYQSGVDVLASDKLGKMALTIDGCRQRDKKVLELCKNNRIPVVVSMGGGYSERIALMVEAHANTFRLAQAVFF